MITSTIYDFQSAMARAGLPCSAPIIADGKIHRFGFQDGKGKKPCWYVLHFLPNGLAWGRYGCWQPPFITEAWSNRETKDLSGEEMELIRQKREQVDADIQEKQIQARKSVQNIWEKALPNLSEHAYLTRKQIKSFGLRLHKGTLIIPLYNEHNELCSLQFITANGEKWFKKDASTKGCFFTIGEFGEKIYLAEGYATAATIHEATGCAVVVAFSAHNMPLVAKIIRDKHPKHTIIICSDNDAFTTTGNAGMQKSTEAAQTINAKLVIPKFNNTDSKPTDFNDLQMLEGLNEVRNQLASAKEVEPMVDEKPDKRPSQTSLLIELTKDLELFHDKQNIAYATLGNNGHKETWRLDCQNFQDWLCHTFWRTYQKAISKNVLQDALGILRGKACFEGDCKEVYTRVAMAKGAIYINLANENWEVVQVTKDGLVILKDSPVKFTRLSNMQPLPVPINGSKSGNNVAAMWQYLNLPEKCRKLVLAFILECFRANTPFPVLVLYGAQGSAKSSTQEMIRMLIDPSTCNLRTAPKKNGDLLVAAANNWVVSFNNVSYLSDVQQDDLCSVATGGALATRELYTTHNEASISVKRPVIINGIGDLVTAQDLIDRCIILELPEIEPSLRKTEEEVMLEFNKDYPVIFGALLDILAQTLKELPNVKLENKPRMADFAMLGTALERAMRWEEGSFMKDYLHNRKENMSSAMEHSPIAVAITKFITDTFSYDGSYNALFERLNVRYKPEMAGWPKSAKGLANQIKRQKQALLAIGIDVIFDKQCHQDGYHVCIKKVENNVHQVHDVHIALPDNGFGHELANSITSPSSQCTCKNIL